jgi:hypothetical protein
MDCIFNELSATVPAENKFQAIGWIETFLDTCIKLEYLLVEDKIPTRQLRVRVRDDFLLIQLSPNYTINDWLCDSNVDFNLKTLLLGLRQSPCIDDEVQEERFILEHIYFEEPQQKPEGLVVAYLNGSLAISFDSHSKWDKTYIPLIRVVGEKQEELQIRHISKANHVKEHKVWLLKTSDFNWLTWQPSLDNLLPRVHLSNQLVNNDWGKFTRELFAKPPGEKLDTIKKMARNVAEINGYTFNQGLSSHNQKIKKSLRAIYEAGEENNKMYLSTDFEKGRFEVCNYRGKHLGEYNFGGEKTSDADNQGKHDISILN